ncbi:MAG: hypothetical protein ACLTKG_06195 [Collinsella intestinalis]
MLDLEGLDEVQAYESIKRLSEDLDPRMRPLIALDNLTTLQEHGIEAMVGLLRSMRGEGFEIVVTCRPSNRAFVAAMGDSYKITAQSLLVKPREYPAWAQAFDCERVGCVRADSGSRVLWRCWEMRRRSTRCRLPLKTDSRVVSRRRMQVRRSRDSLYRTVCLLIMSGLQLRVSIAQACVCVRTVGFAWLGSIRFSGSMRRETRTDACQTAESRFLS